MRINSFSILICLSFGMYSCREAPARGHSRKDNRERKELVRDHKDNKQAQILAEDIEIPAYQVSDNNILLKRKRYTTLYNVQNRIPDWVAWQLKSEHIEGSYKRLGAYFEDTSVPKPRANDDDYRGSIWSHGHMCPAGDNKWDEDAMRESNYLTNICPQNRSLNSGVWNRLEQSCRIWARKYGNLYIVCGPVLLNTKHETIGMNEVVVPEAFFKVILCIQGTPKAIGFVIRNNEGKKKRDQYVNTIDEVERITGIDFFPALPDSIENVVESYANLEDWK